MGFLGYNRGSDCSFSVGDGDPLGAEKRAIRRSGDRGSFSLLCIRKGIEGKSVT